MTFCGLFFCAVPFLPGASGNIPRSLIFWYFSPFWCGAFAAAVFFFRYRVTVTDETLTVGAFRRRVIVYADVIDCDVIKGLRSSELLVYLRNGQRLRFSGLLNNFDELVGMVTSHTALRPHEQRDSLAKIRDREKRARNSRQSGWIMGVGLGLIALALFIAWKLN
jgi:hypothetical protein